MALVTRCGIPAVAISCVYLTLTSRVRADPQTSGDGAGPPMELTIGLLPAWSASCDDCADGVGGSMEAAVFYRSPHHAVGPAVEHARVPWRFTSVPHRTSGLLAYRFYLLGQGAWDPYLGIAVGRASTRAHHYDCARAVSGWAWQLSAGAGGFVSGSLRLGGRLSAEAAGFVLDCYDDGAQDAPIDDADHPVSATVAVGLELSWAPGRDPRTRNRLP